jgi:hypothetical protein
MVLLENDVVDVGNVLNQPLGHAAASTTKVNKEKQHTIRMLMC